MRILEQIFTSNRSGVVKMEESKLLELLEKRDISADNKEFWAENEFAVFKDFFSKDQTYELLGEKAKELSAQQHRKSVTRYKKSGSLSYFELEELLPEAVKLYRDPRLLKYLSDVVGADLQLCPDRDPHSCALYYYSQEGDHIGFHYDKSFYRGVRYTVLVPLLNDTEHSKLLCELHKDDKTRTQRNVELSTDPGMLIIFNGDKLWHAVSPLGKDEERIILTMEFVTDGHMSLPKRIISDVKDAIAYFGFRGIKRRKAA